MKKLIFLSLMMSLNAFANTPFTPIVGVTTNLDDSNCVAYDGDAFDANPEIDYFSQECTGLGGWRVQPYGGDSRAFLKLINGKQVVDLQESMTEAGQFPNAGGKIEWRVQRVRGQSATPYALLADVTAQNPEDIQKSNGQVLIVKLGRKSCVMAKVDFDGLQNASRDAAWAKARQQADAKAPTFVCP